MKGKLRTAGWSIVFLVLSFLSLSWGTVEITPKEALVYTWQAVLGVESGSVTRPRKHGKCLIISYIKKLRG